MLMLLFGGGFYNNGVEGHTQTVKPELSEHDEKYGHEIGRSMDY